MGRQEQQSESIMGHTRSEDGLTNQVPFFELLTNHRRVKVTQDLDLRTDCGILYRCCSVQSEIPGVMTNEEGIFINIKLVSLSRLLAHKWSAQ